MCYLKGCKAYQIERFEKYEYMRGYVRAQTQKTLRCGGERESKTYM